VSPKDSVALRHVMFCFVDHFEPDWKNADKQQQTRRVDRWVKEYPDLASKHTDTDGCHPRHTFFYPAEVYQKEHLDKLAKICQEGFGEVEVHLHHDQDNEESLVSKLEKAKKDFAAHGLLGRDKKSGETRYGFIHGNWALNNSREDRRWCGVNNETELLQKTGCYADFTLPSAPSETQTAKINSLYYAKSSSETPKGHNKGSDVEFGCNHADGLIMIQGPLALNFKRGLKPRIENGDITGHNPPTENRIDLWVNQQISVKNLPDWVFVKVHTHGAQENNMEGLLGSSLEQLWSYLETKYNDGVQYALHYVSAREMYNIIKAAEDGCSGNPGNYRDYKIESNMKRIMNQ